jgi:hypothetical protein
MTFEQRRFKVVEERHKLENFGEYYQMVKIGPRRPLGMVVCYLKI